MQEGTLVLHPETNMLVRKTVIENYEDIEIAQLEAKVASDTEAVVNAQAYALAVARGVTTGANDVTQLSLAFEDEDKAKAALEDSKSELSVGEGLVASSSVSGSEMPSEDGTDGSVENKY